MIELIDLAIFKTGLDLEREFNRIIRLALHYEMSHVEAGERLDELYDYGVSSCKFTKRQNESYMNRKNFNRDGSVRSHFAFAQNLNKSQDNEHKVFLYFLKWLGDLKPNSNIVWDYNGSDSEGYMMIVSPKVSKVIEPDYKITISNSEGDELNKLVETKSFASEPVFKVANLKKYVKMESYLSFKYNGQHYFTGINGMNEILKLDFTHNFGQDTVLMDDGVIQHFVNKTYFKEI